MTSDMAVREIEFQRTLEANGSLPSRNGDGFRDDALRTELTPHVRAIEASGLGFWDWNMGTDEVWLSHRCIEILGVAPEERPSKLSDLLQLMMPDDPEFARRELSRHLLEGHEYDQVHFASGIGRWLRFQGRAGCSEQGEPRHASGCVQDVTEAKARAEGTSAIADSLFQRVAVIDSSGSITHINRAWAEGAFEGGANLSAVGLGSNYLYVCRKSAAGGCAEAQTMLEGIEWVMDRVRDHFEMEYECTAPGGPERYFSARVTPFRADLAGVVIAHDEITDIKRLEAALLAQRTTDALTGLPNREALLERLTRLYRATGPRPFCLMLADIDDLKAVNDTWGHTSGDRVLVEIAARLTAVARGCDVARVGRDEFSVLIEGSRAQGLKRTAANVARRLAESLDEPIRVGRTEGVRVRVSIGASLSGNSVSPNAIETAAEMALQVSKQQRDGRIVFDDGDEVGKLLGRYTRIREVGDALKQDRLRLDFQPIVEASSFTPSSAEALLRWVSPNGSVFSAGSFMPALAGTAAETDVDRWVIREACRQWAQWRREHGNAWSLKAVTVNVSRKSLALEDFPDWYGTVLKEFGVRGRSIALEITEGGPDSMMDALILNCQKIKEDYETDIWLDDIGKAYSSFEWLYQMPGSVTKVDPSYLKKSFSRAAKRRVARSLVQLVKALGGRLVAECVEDRDDVELWREAGCDLLQGYFFAKPMCAARLSEWMFQKKGSTSGT